MRLLQALALAVLFSALAIPTALAPQGTGSFVEWPTYKYDMSRTGFFDTHKLYGAFNYSDFRILWRVKTQLCISSSPAVGDLDGDGRPEVIFSSCDGHLYVVRGSDGGMLWNSTTGGGFASPTLWDLDGDGLPEIVTLGASGTLYAFKGNGGELWEVPGTFISGSPGIADVNGDGWPEVLAPSFEGKLYVISHDGRVLQAIRVGSYPVSTPAIADVDGNGVPDAVVTDGPSLVLVAFKPGGYDIYHVDFNDSLVGPPALYDLTGDGHPDAVVVSQDCMVSIIDLVGGAVKSARLPGASECYSPPSVGDVTGDGRPDIVVGSLQGLYVLSSNLSVEYRFPEIKIYTSSPIIADVDGDGRNEILVGQESGEFDIIDLALAGGPYEEVQWFLVTGRPIMGSAAVADVDGDNAPEILVGSRDFILYCIKGVGASHATPNQAVTTTVAGAMTRTQTASPNPAGPRLPQGPAPPGVLIKWRIVAAAVAVAVIIAVLATFYSKP